MKKTFVIAVTFLTVLLFLSCGQTVNGQAANPASDFEVKENEDGTIYIEKYIGQSKDVVIPAKIKGKDVTVIGSFSFSPYETDVASVVIPDSVTTIEGLALMGAGSITLGSNVNFIDGSSGGNGTGMSDTEIIAAYNRNGKQAGTYYFDKDRGYRLVYQKPAVQTAAKQTGTIPLESGMWVCRPGTRATSTVVQRSVGGGGRVITTDLGYEEVYAYIFRDGRCTYYNYAFNGTRGTWNGTYTTGDNTIIARYSWNWNAYQKVLARTATTISDGERTYTWEDVEDMDAFCDKYGIKGKGN